MLRSNSLMWLTTEHNDIISLIYHKSIIIMLLSSDSFSQSYDDNIFYCNKVDYGKDFMSAALYFETTVRYDQRIDFEIHSAKDFLKHVLLTKHYWTGVFLSNYICRNTLQQTEKNWEVWVPRAIQEKLAAMIYRHIWQSTNTSDKEPFRQRLRSCKNFMNIEKGREGFIWSCALFNCTKHLRKVNQHHRINFPPKMFSTAITLCYKE